MPSVDSIAEQQRVDDEAELLGVDSEVDSEMDSETDFDAGYIAALNDQRTAIAEALALIDATNARLQQAEDERDQARRWAKAWRYACKCLWLHTKRTDEHAVWWEWRREYRRLCYGKRRADSARQDATDAR